MNIAICFGPSWLKHIPVELYSLLRSNKIKSLYLLSDNIRKDDLEPIEKLCDDFSVGLHFINMKPWEETHVRTKKNVDSRFTKYTLYRLGIPDFVPEDRVLYLDADTLVISDISDFYNTDLGSNVIAGCIDTGIGLEHRSQIGSDPSHPYINAGVILMDLKKIRELGLTRTWISMMNNKHFPAHDQDIIHLTLSGKAKIFPPVYNCSLSTAYDMSNNELKIVHYAGDKSKDWVYSLPKADLWKKAEAEYLKYLDSMVELKAQRIDKTIAYGWFGRGEKPNKIKQCIESWHKFCPDWKIVELNEDNCDTDILPFVAGAYKAKKYAFVADFFRLKAMYDLGCVTLDADVELIRPIDCFLHHRMFSGQEIDNEVLITAVMGAEKGHPMVKTLMDYYTTEKWYSNYRKPNTKWITNIFKSRIRQRLRDGSIIISGGVHLYPKYYFCNYDHKNRRLIPDVRSYTIHHFEGSWK